MGADQACPSILCLRRRRHDIVAGERDGDLSDLCRQQVVLGFPGPEQFANHGVRCVVGCQGDEGLCLSETKGMPSSRMDEILAEAVKVSAIVGSCLMSVPALRLRHCITATLFSSHLDPTDRPDGWAALLRPHGRQWRRRRRHQKFLMSR